MILKHSFSPAHNTRLAHLCGPMDAHLRQIEMTLRVKISHRQENFRIEGAKVQAERAMQVLQAAYEMAARPIAVEHLQLMLAGDTPLAEAEDGSKIGRAHV